MDNDLLIFTIFAKITKKKMRNKKSKQFLLLFLCFFRIFAKTKKLISRKI